MKFEILNDNGSVVFNTTDDECLPTIKEIDSMVKAKYKFKLDGKLISKNKLIEKFNHIYKK